MSTDLVKDLVCAYLCLCACVCVVRLIYLIRTYTDTKHTDAKLVKKIKKHFFFLWRLGVRFPWSRHSHTTVCNFNPLWLFAQIKTKAAENMKSHIHLDKKCFNASLKATRNKIKVKKMGHIGLRPWTWYLVMCHNCHISQYSSSCRTSSIDSI